LIASPLLHQGAGPAQRALWGGFTERHAVFAIAANHHEDHARDL